MVKNVLGVEIGPVYTRRQALATLGTPIMLAGENPGLRLLSTVGPAALGTFNQLLRARDQAVQDTLLYEKELEKTYADIIQTSPDYREMLGAGRKRRNTPRRTKSKVTYASFLEASKPKRKVRVRKTIKKKKQPKRKRNKKGQYVKAKRKSNRRNR